MSYEQDKRTLLAFMANPLPEPPMTETQTDPNACAHCGGKVSSYPQGCPGCGAPTCCQKCCDEANQERLAEQTPIRAIPMHPPMKHLTALSYFLIAGFQPRGRTELFQQPKGPSVMEQAAQVVMAALKRAQSPANAPCIETLSQ